MSKQNKWKQIKPTKGQTYTISDDDYKKLGDMLPNKQSDMIDDLTDLSTFIYYTLVNLMNKADVTNDANELRRDIYNAYYTISQKLPTDIAPSDNKPQGGWAEPLTKQDIEDPYFGEPRNLEEATVQDEKEHFGEEQAEGLDNLLEGLKDTPHDDRW